MVYGACYYPLSQSEKVKELGVADSKVLTEDMRDELFQKINSDDSVGWLVEIISPSDISTKMLARTKYSLNAVSHDAAINLIRQSIQKGVQVKEIYVDTVGVAENYQNKLSELFPDITIKVTPKADALFPCVSAASIIAKVTRDKVLSNWKFPEDESYNSSDYGCGYPSDPATQKWLNSNLDKVFGYPQFVRFSWSTCQKILDESAVRVHWEDDEEFDNDNTVSLLSFFTQKGVQEKAVKRHNFLESRKLKQVVKF
ncbi:Ribonuclease H2 subunit A [Trichoplax sp. H2]|nr:Ribonuclease H2 subunit A [Trichoplax sp. H2]|eukprot:RDD36361.1 Ribonuclease H2 subunit A [Trichoplax sp. H2]